LAKTVSRLFLRQSIQPLTDHDR
ncbi:MAG: hypothetical protein JWQ11_2981, partial [Rhizobacter sp.]|nr:hypothetical protein [Rhizobacter sp.]